MKHVLVLVTLALVSLAAACFGRLRIEQMTRPLTGERAAVRVFTRVEEKMQKPARGVPQGRENVS